MPLFAQSVHKKNSPPSGGEFSFCVQPVTEVSVVPVPGSVTVVPGDVVPEASVPVEPVSVVPVPVPAAPEASVPVEPLSVEPVLVLVLVLVFGVLS